MKREMCVLGYFNEKKKRLTTRPVLEYNEYINNLNRNQISINKIPFLKLNPFG